MINVQNVFLRYLNMNLQQLKDLNLYNSNIDNTNNNEKPSDQIKKIIMIPKSDMLKIINSKEKNNLLSSYLFSVEEINNFDSFISNLKIVKIYWESKFTSDFKINVGLIVGLEIKTFFANLCFDVIMVYDHNSDEFIWNNSDEINIIMKKYRDLNNMNDFQIDVFFDNVKKKLKHYDVKKKFFEKFEANAYCLKSDFIYINFDKL